VDVVTIGVNQDLGRGRATRLASWSTPIWTLPRREPVRRFIDSLPVVTRSGTSSSFDKPVGRWVQAHMSCGELLAWLRQWSQR
jgi:hypothetical protein